MYRELEVTQDIDKIEENIALYLTDCIHNEEYLNRHNQSVQLVIFRILTKLIIRFGEKDERKFTR